MGAEAASDAAMLTTNMKYGFTVIAGLDATLAGQRGSGRTVLANYKPGY
jgi:hypothetical protein